MNSKLRSIAALVLACVIQLSGTGNLWAQDNDYWVKIAFLGYYKDYHSFVTSPSYPQLRQAYPDLKTIKSLAVDAEGEEFYLVIPSKGHDVNVNACTSGAWYDLTHNDKWDQLTVNEQWAQLADVIFRGGIHYTTEGGSDASSGGKPFLMRCNRLDTSFPNSMLVIDGGRDVYYPCLDLNQGAMLHHARVKDISRPLPQSDPDESGLYADMGIYALVKNGKVFLLFNWDRLNSSGYIQVDGEESSRSFINAVEEINGICRKVFIGSIGQDINPWLCMLMDDGTVRILHIFDALHRNDFAASPALPGFSDIISFEEGGAGEIEPVVFSYGTIFGIDKKGDRHEIPVFFDDGRYTFDVWTREGECQANLILRSNWRMKFLLSTEFEVSEYRVGGFFEAETRYDSSDCNFRLTDEYTNEEGRKQEESGTFRLTTKDDKYILNPLSGFALYGKVDQEMELKKEEDPW